MDTDHYRILGIPATASSKEVKRAYRQLARRWHPDINPHDSRAAEEFRRVGEAYQVLGDPCSRAGYDQLRLSSPPPLGPVPGERQHQVRPSRSAVGRPDRRVGMRSQAESHNRLGGRAGRGRHGEADACAPARRPVSPTRRRSFTRLGERLRLLTFRLLNWLRGRPNPRLAWEVVPTPGPHLILDMRLPRWLALKGTSVHLTLQEREHPLYLFIPPGVQDGTCLKVADPFWGPRRRHLFINILLVP